MKIEKAYCMFEQSGTFKQAFLNENIPAVDLDIENRFGKTDVVIDLFHEIHQSFLEQKTIFDAITKKDLIFAFFPCTYFENQINLSFRGQNFHDRKKTEEEILENVRRLEQKRASFYQIFCEFFLVCKKKNLRVIIENPYSKEHYLNRYFPIKSTLIDYDRHKHGDLFKKPTQYWFVNCEPELKMEEEIYITLQPKRIEDVSGFARSMISPIYAKYFINTFIL